MSDPTIPSTPSPLTPSPGAYRGMVGSSPPMRCVFAKIPRLAGSDVSVLIHGESGAGKEGVARAIHDESSRKAGPWLAINCSSLTPDMAASLLFGHVKGAYSGAISDSPGYFGKADGGTLFLDEVAELSLAIQPLLLRALEAGEVLPVGATEPRPVDVRIVSATHVDLCQAIAQHRFRRDLYTRLRGAVIQLPSLRERPSDLPSLIEHFLRQPQNAALRARLSPPAMERLLAYPFPGNVRELELVLEEAALTASDPTCIRADELNLERPKPQPEAGAAVDSAATEPPPSPARRIRTLATIVKEAKQEALDRNHGNRHAAAKELGISASTMKRFNRSDRRLRTVEANGSGSLPERGKG